jgi:molybdopterin converting factor small subunit
MMVKVVITGRGYDAAQDIPAQLSLAEGATVDDALQSLDRLLPKGRRLAASCLIAVSGDHLGTLAQHRPRLLHEGEELLVIAPVAGG